MVQWYPGHIARAERNLREQLKAVDIVLEVRDGRCPMSTRHPLIPEWIGTKPRVLLINRKDMVAEADRAAWTRFFAQRGHAVTWTNGSMGDGVGKVGGRAGRGAQFCTRAQGTFCCCVPRQPGRRGGQGQAQPVPLHPAPPRTPRTHSRR